MRSNKKDTISPWIPLYCVVLFTTPPLCQWWGSVARMPELLECLGGLLEAGDLSVSSDIHLPANCIIDIYYNRLRQARNDLVTMHAVLKEMVYVHVMFSVASFTTNDIWPRLNARSCTNIVYMTISMFNHRLQLAQNDDSHEREYAVGLLAQKFPISLAVLSPQGLSPRAVPVIPS